MLHGWPAFVERSEPSIHTQILVRGSQPCPDMVPSGDHPRSALARSTRPRDPTENVESAREEFGPTTHRQRAGDVESRPALPGSGAGQPARGSSLQPSPMGLRAGRGRGPTMEPGTGRALGVNHAPRFHRLDEIGAWRAGQQVPRRRDEVALHRWADAAGSAEMGNAGLRICS